MRRHHRIETWISALTLSATLAACDKKAGDRATMTTPSPPSERAVRAADVAAKPAAAPSMARTPGVVTVAAPTNREDYGHKDAHTMVATAEKPLSTFGVDVDTASYSIARKKILAGDAVPPDAVRVEEFLNYFRYDYATPTGDAPFAVHMEGAPSPYSPGRTLLRVALQGKTLAKSQRKPAHLVFLVDVSGSMNEPDKLPLIKQSLRLLLNNLNDGDTVALVTYASGSRIVLQPTGIDHKAEILGAIDELTPGGSTAMSSGIDLAYDLAASSLSADSVSRVILCTDGDTNVGPHSFEEILASVAAYTAKGVTLTTIGFGMGNYKDNLLGQLADKGNGNHAYIGDAFDARKVFQEQLGGTVEVIAKDVKVQVEFDPRVVTRYRLVGYEKRDLADEDFRNDAVDAGEIGSGHSVTALYEVELAPTREEADGPVATVRIRAKKPDGVEAVETTHVLTATHLRPRFLDASMDFRFAVAVMGAAEILRRSPESEGWKLEQVTDIARAATGEVRERLEFVNLLSRPIKLAAR